MFPIQLQELSDKERHDYILKTFILSRGKNREPGNYKRDIDVIRNNHRFLWDEEDVSSASWETRLARRYYDKLFREYCIADLTRHKDNKVALRWRTKEEVVSGKGQFQCGSQKCQEHDDLQSWEVNFNYLENGERKNALVKLRLCPEHAIQLNYTSRSREMKRLKRFERQNLKSKKSRPSEKKLCSEESDASTAIDTIKDNNPVEVESVIGNVEEGSPHIESPEQDVWNKKPEVEMEQCSRENDFERYLENLLL